MSFHIKAKRKINLLRKCVQIISHRQEDLQILFTKTFIRFSQAFSEDVNYHADFQAAWFTKFLPPECI